MSGSIEEVGARLVLKNRAAFRAGLKEMSRDAQAFGKTTVKVNTDIAAATKAAANAQVDYAAKSQAAADATAKAMEAKTAAVRAAAAGDKEATAAAKAYSDAMTAEMVAANNAKRAAGAQATAASAQVTAVRRSATAHDAHARAVTGSSAALGGLAKVGKVAVLGGLAASAALAYEGAKAFSTYQQALEAVHTQAGLTQPRVDKLGKALLKMSGSGQIPVGPTDLANILYRVASSTAGMGYSDARLIAMTKAAAQLAVIGGPGTDVEQTARIVGGIKATGIKGAGNPQNIVALANATVGAGDLRMSDFVDFVGTGVLSSANLAGVTLPQVAGMLSLLGDNLQSGQVSGHSVAHALQLLAAPSHIGMQAYGAIGLHGTQMGDLMRTQGLPAALGVFMKHLAAPVTANSTTTDYLKKYLGMSGGQIQSAQIHGLSKTEQGMLLTRAFGGAKQAIPIETVLTEYPRYLAKLGDAKKLMGNFNETWSATMKEPANQLKALNAQWQTFEVEVGGKVLPVLINGAHWLGEHKTLIKDIAIGLGVALIPTTAAWFGLLATRGITAVGGMLGLMRNTNTEVGKTGGIASAQAGGLGRFGGAVAGVTAAIGIWELGRATAGHGSAGALTAGLGGAIAGMTVGLAVGGPWGAAIGGAAGALIGLAGHFWNVKSSVDGTNGSLSSMVGLLAQALGSDKGAVGTNTKAAVESLLSHNSVLTGELAKYHVTESQLMQYLQGGYESQTMMALFQAADTGLLGKGGKNQLATDLSTLLQAFGAAQTQAQNLLTVINGPANPKYPDQAPGWRPPMAPGFVPPSPIPHNARRALGGPVYAGHTYQVNEAGAELFTPAVNGRIFPHAQLSTLAASGGLGAGLGAGHGVCVIEKVEQNFVGAFTTPKEIAAAAKQGLTDAMARQ